MSKLPRDMLAQILSNNTRAIKAFEDVFDSTNDLLPSQIVELRNQNESTLSVAQSTLAGLFEVMQTQNERIDALSQQLNEIYAILKEQENPVPTLGDLAYQNANSIESLTMNNGYLINSIRPLVNGASVNTGTLLNSPVIGNPTKWVPINDAGTIRYIPAF